MSKIKLLIVEDEVAISQGLMDLFTFHGYDVQLATNGEEGLKLAQSGAFDLILLDVMLPIKDGFEVCNEIRKQDREQPISMLTAKSQGEDIENGLTLGADDYITKPFSQRLLLARIRAVLRRASDGVMKTSGPNIIRLGELLMDPDRHLCSWRGTEVKLTDTEFLILQALASRPGMVKNRDQLMDAAYGESIFLDDRTIDSHIKRLRRKLRAHDSDFDQIETLYGIGYKYKTSPS